jgi:uncharacterized repeat protein (TIGR02543 family)
MTSDVGGIDCNDGGGTCTQNYDNGTPVTLTATPNTNATFVGWSGACSGTSSTCQVTMDQARDVTATFATPTVTLTVHITGNGATLTTDGFACEASTCTKDYAGGTAVTLAETPAADSSFVGWSGDCSGTGTTCDLTMSQDRDVTATFSSNTPNPTLTVRLAGVGHGRADSTSDPGIACGADCVETYTNGQVVTLAAKAKKGSAFKSFTGCDSVQGKTCTVTLDTDRTVVVTFDPKRWLRLKIPSQLVLHAPYGRAKITARVERNGKPLKGARVNVSIHCPGEKKSKRHGRTNRKGVVRFHDGRDMPNSVRLLSCRVIAKTTVNHHKLKAHGRVRFIHPYWLKVLSQSKDGRHVVIDAFARPGWTFYAYVNATRIKKGKTHKNGWVKISLPTARPGDLIWLAGINHHYYSHVVTLGKTPKTAKVNPDHSKR